MWLKLVERVCPVCGSDRAPKVFAETNIDPKHLGAFAFASRKLPEYMHHRLVTCPSCDLLYANPIPQADGLAKAYAEAAYDSGDEARCAARTYAKLVAAIASDLPDRTGALDIGTGDGAFLEQLLALGFTDVTGVEPSAAPVAAARDEIRPLIRQASFDDADFDSERFSLITCFQTIEHLSDPLAICRAAYRLLKPGGAFVLVAHNRRAVSARLLGRKSPIFDVEHLQLFSPKSLAALLRRAAFGGIGVRPLMNRYPIHYWMKLFPAPMGLKGPLLAQLKRTRLGSLPLSLPAGNLAAIAFKPETPSVRCMQRYRAITAA